MADPLTFALVDSYEGPHAAKRMARDAQVSQSAAHKWLWGLALPNSRFLLRMAQRNEKLREHLARLMAEDCSND